MDSPVHAWFPLGTHEGQDAREVIRELYNSVDAVLMHCFG